MSMDKTPVLIFRSAAGRADRGGIQAYTDSGDWIGRVAGFQDHGAEIAVTIVVPKHRLATLPPVAAKEPI